MEIAPFVRNDALKTMLMKTQISKDMNSCRGPSSFGLFEPRNWLQQCSAKSTHIFRKGTTSLFSFLYRAIVLDTQITKPTICTNVLF